MEPASDCRMEAFSVAEYPGMHKYSPVRGRKSLLEGIAERTRYSGDNPAELDNILVTAGATGGLYALMATCVPPR